MIGLPNVQRASRLLSPAYSLWVDGIMASEVLRDRLVSLSVTLNNGVVNDQLSLTFDDRAQLHTARIHVPEPGAVISVSLGYGYGPLLEPMGEFEVNQVSLNGSNGGRTLTVSANPTLLFRDETHTCTGLTLEDIVSDIARRHELQPKVSPNLKTIEVGALNQQNESDSAFLTRLAARYNAVCKVMAGRLLFMKKGEGTSASGLPMPAVTVPNHDIISWNRVVSQHEQDVEVVAGYHDHRSAREVEVTVHRGRPGNGATLIKLPYLFANETDARHAASSKLRELQRDEDGVSMTLLGNQSITAEGRIAVKDVRDGVSGEYIVRSVTHSLSTGGFQSSLQAYVEPRSTLSGVTL